MFLVFLVAFQIHTPVTAACHENITLDATRMAGFPDLARAPAPNEDQGRAMDDLTFSLPEDNVWTLALLIGVRSNDVRDLSPTAVNRLGAVHDDPHDQQAHCLRAPDEDGTPGDAAAIAACRQFIIDELDRGHLLDEPLDLDSQETVSVFLAIRGKVTIFLPRFAYHLGRALHTIQDSFPHTFRDPNARITSVLNWVDYLDDYRESRDGYHHISPLDDCSRTDERERTRVARATEASRQVVVAIADPAPGRRLRVIAIVDQILAYTPGCDSTNAYCNATELDEESQYGGCAVAGGGIGLVVLLLFLRRRAVLLVLLVPLSARADDHWHFDARGGASLDETAIAASVGVGRDFSRWTAGFQAEVNPWISIDAEKIVPGAFNAYFTLARRWYVRPELSIYSRAELGSSTILFKLVGIDRGTTGVYYGGVLVGLRIPIKRCVDFTFDPSHLAMPTPKFFGGGFPFYYGQWRVTLGIEARL